jgi:hydroxymethylbilane synthase
MTVTLTNAAPDRPLKLGTRASPLAMAQAHMVADALCAAFDWSADRITICPVTASGDKILERPLADIGGKALWTKELDIWLGTGEIDFAVHSMKDVETVRPAALTIAAMLPRADVRDRLIGADSVAALPQGARVGTSSPRRAAQLLHLRPDLEIVMFRGNVATRLKRLADGEAAATLLAAAGLDRLGQHETGVAVPIDQMLPAASQGAIGIECLTDNATVRHLLAAISDRDTVDCVMAERRVLEGLNAGCHSPVAAHAVVDGDRLRLRAELLSEDGAERISDQAMIQRDDRAACHRLAHDMLNRASPALRQLFG